MLSWAKMHVYDLGIITKRAQDPLRVPNAMIDVRVHLPAGARKKGGLSAGVAMVRSSLFLSGFGDKTMVVCPFYDRDRRGAQNKVTPSVCPRPDMGVVLLQITLRGRVSPVGWIKGKVLGAHRAGANRVILSRQWANLKDVGLDVVKEVQAHTVRVCEEGARGARCCFWTWLVAVAPAC